MQRNPERSERMICDKAPDGWGCTRDQGHDGPCAAVPVVPGEAQRKPVTGMRVEEEDEICAHPERYGALGKALVNLRATRGERDQAFNAGLEAAANCVLNIENPIVKGWNICADAIRSLSRPTPAVPSEVAPSREQQLEGDASSCSECNTPLSLIDGCEWGTHVMCYGCLEDALVKAEAREQRLEDALRSLVDWHDAQERIPYIVLARHLDIARSALEAK